jgi:hypothetical protein
MDNHHVSAEDLAQLKQIVKGLPPEMRRQSNLRYRADMRRLRRGCESRRRPEASRGAPRARSSCRVRRPGARRARPATRGDPHLSDGDDPPGEPGGLQHVGAVLGRYLATLAPIEVRS